MNRAALEGSADEPILRAIARHGTPTSHSYDGVHDGHTICHCWQAAGRSLAALRAAGYEVVRRADYSGADISADPDPSESEQVGPDL